MKRRILLSFLLTVLMVLCISEAVFAAGTTPALMYRDAERVTRIGERGSYKVPEENRRKELLDYKDIEVGTRDSVFVYYIDEKGNETRLSANDLQTENASILVIRPDSDNPDAVSIEQRKSGISAIAYTVGGKTYRLMAGDVPYWEFKNTMTKPAEQGELELCFYFAKREDGALIVDSSGNYVTDANSPLNKKSKVMAENNIAVVKFYLKDEGETEIEVNADKLKLSPADSNIELKVENGASIISTANAYDGDEADILYTYKGKTYKFHVSVQAEPDQSEDAQEEEEEAGLRFYLLAMGENGYATDSKGHYVIDPDRGPFIIYEVHENTNVRVKFYFKDEAGIEIPVNPKDLRISSATKSFALRTEKGASRINTSNVYVGDEADIEYKHNGEIYKNHIIVVPRSSESRALRSIDVSNELSLNDNKTEIKAETQGAGWNLLDQKWYFFSNDGKKETGWIISGNAWYYLSPTDGEMLTGWQMVDGKWYYLNPNGGAMLTGWQLIDGKYYYMTSSGDLLVNTITPDGYHVDANGVWIQ